MLDLLDVSIREHPMTDLKNYQQSSLRYSPEKRACRLRISLYPGSDPEAFINVVEISLKTLHSALETANTVK